MLAYAQRIVQRAFGRPDRPWMSVAGVAGVVPPSFGLWVLAWPGLRALAGGGGLLASASALAMCALGAWALRAWLKIQELHALAETMSLGLPTDGEQGGAGTR
jgi:hypothetical protein